MSPRRRCRRPENGGPTGPTRLPCPRRTRYAHDLLTHLLRLGYPIEQADALLQEFFLALFCRSESFQPLGLFPAQTEGRVWLWMRLRALLPWCLQALRRPSGARGPSGPRDSVVEQEGTLGAALMAIGWQVQARRMDPGYVRAFVLVELDRFSLEEAAAIEQLTVKMVAGRVEAAHREVLPMACLVRLLCAKRERGPWSVLETRPFRSLLSTRVTSHTGASKAFYPEFN